MSALSDIFADLLIVAITAACRYAAPTANRTFTTSALYYTGLALYLLAYFMLYELLSAVTHDIGLPSTRIWLAFLVGLALPMLFPFSRADAALRRYLQRVVSNIPGEAQRIQQIMLQAHFEPPEEVRERTRVLLKRRGLDLDQQILAGESQLEEVWYRSLALYQQLLEWRSKPSWAVFFEMRRLEFDTMRERFDQLTFKVSRISNTLHRIDALVDAPPTAPLASLEEQVDTEIYDDRATGLHTARDTMRVIKDDLRVDLSFFLRYVCLFAARAVLSQRVTKSGRARAYAALGFAAPRFEQAHYGVVLAMFLLVVLTMIIAFLAIGTSGGGRDHTVLLSVMIGLNQSIALFLPCYAKMRLGCANAGIFGSQPWPFFLAVGLVAALVTYPVSILFRSQIILEKLGYELFVTSAVWQIMSFMTATVAAVLVQDGTWAATASRRRKRIKDAIVFALGLVAAFTTVWYLLGVLHQQRPPYPSVVSSIVMGLAFGYMVPWSFRHPSMALRTSRAVHVNSSAVVPT